MADKKNPWYIQLMFGLLAFVIIGVIKGLTSDSTKKHDGIDYHSPMYDSLSKRDMNDMLKIDSVKEEDTSVNNTTN